MRLAAVFLALFSAIASAEDAAAILAKSRAAFIQNHERERFWNWTTLYERSVVDKNDALIEKLPSVTIESPIRADGKRCSALLAWGDGVEPYLANASAEQRCAVQEEVKELFTMEAFLESRQVKVQSQNASGITLVISLDKEAMKSSDASKRCVASVKGTVRVNLPSYFPTDIQATMPGSACIETRHDVANHYDDSTVKNVTAGQTKGSFIRQQYELQKDKGGDHAKDFWICKHRYSMRPLQKGATAILISGRRFQLTSTGDRRMIIEARTNANELTAESLIKFETEKEK